MHMVLNEKTSTVAELSRQLGVIQKNEMLIKMLNGINLFIIILNEQREILFMNKEICSALGVDNLEVLGMRPGELLKCRNSEISEKGCGHAKACNLCNAKNLVVEVINTHEVSEGQVTIVSIIEGLEVSSTFHERVTEVDFEGEKFYMVAFLDKSADVERNNIERIFFHDILNSASSLYNAIRLLKMGNKKFSEDEDIIMVEGYIKNIIEEIEYQRSVSSAEHNQLKINLEKFDLGELIEKVLSILNKDERFSEIKVENTIFCGKYFIISDRVLLRRIIMNMIKNAMEANENQSVIKIHLEESDNEYSIGFFNREVIPLSVQVEIFGKGVSTKGKGRGFGTYGSKLLLNKYLRSDLKFDSKENIGTEFTILIPKENL